MEKYKDGYYFDEFANLFNKLGFHNFFHHEPNNMLEFYNESNNIRYSIYVNIGWGENGFWIGNVSSSIAFLEVNDILKKYIPVSPFKIIHATIDNGYIKNDWSQLMKDKFNFYLKSNEDLDKLKEKLKNYTEKYILPFFNLFPNLHAIEIEIYNKLSYDEYPDYFPGNCTFKNLIIMQLLNNKKLQDYIIYKDQDYRNYVNQNPQMWQSAYDDFKNLVKDIQLKEYEKNSPQQ